jgi:DNA-binding SARP family transcriptional activator
MRIGVLGSTIATDEHNPVALGGPKQRALLAALALHRGRAVSVDTLADLVWDGGPPAGAAGTLQGYVAGLRRALEPDRSARGAGTLLVTEQPGYALRVGEADLDAQSFERAVGAAHAITAPLAAALLEPEPRPPALDTGTLVELQITLADALALWRAAPYADLGDAPAVAAERARLEELHLLAQEDRAVLGLLLGRPAPVAAELESLTRQHPLRERLWALRAVALAGSGRQADALAVLREVRALLDDELALEPGPELRAVQTAVLRQQTAPPPVAPTAASPRPTRAHASHRPAAPWPLAGRDTELASLTAALDAVLDGAGPAFAALTGEPGIGKTRLASELVGYGAGRDMRVVVGRCSQDDGAPALWPWATILGELGSELPTSSGEVDGAAAFRAAQSVVDSVLSAAEAPLLLVLDDLHWADTSTLRVLRLLAETTPAQPCRLFVVATWREHPTPTGPLADVAESFARRHAVRLQLRGLAPAEAARIVEEVAHAAPSDQEAADLCRRTDGNPFFLVEYARLAGDGDDLAALMAEANPPAAVHEVLVRRLDRLAAPTRELLHRASVIGRVFEVDVLAATSGLSDDAVLDTLDPALDAGLVTEDSVDRFRFTHALVRDTALTMLPQSRRARVHARAAVALASRAGREAEIAHHWLAAGPRHRREAWRAAGDAAAAAAAVHAYVEALEMLETALAGQGEDPEATLGERFELLVLLAEVLRRAGRWIELRTVAHDAYEIAIEIGDVDLEALAGILTSTGALWQASESGSVDEVMVAWLRSTLDRLPSGDDERRCRLMLALASENYYGSTPQELSALSEEALAMADRLGEIELRLYASLQAAIVVWRSSTAPYRLDITTQAIGLAREVGDELALVSAMTLRAVALGELGRADISLEQSAEARREAERIHHLYALLVLDSLDVGWLALRGEFDQVEVLVAHMVGISHVVSITGTDEAIAGALTMQMLWQGRDEELVAALMAIEPTTWLPLATTLAAMMCRTGRVDDARAYFDTHPEQVAQAMSDDNWFSPMAWCLGAETALHLGEADLAATAYERLTALSGRPCCAGSGNTLGPADMFLAMAAAATGELELARKHAARAEELCEEWQIPLAAQWVRRERDRWNF